MQQCTPNRKCCTQNDVDRPALFRVVPKRVALAAVDWCAATKETTSRTDYECGFDPYLTDIAEVADAEGCDTIVYSLWSHDVRSMGRLNQRRVFGSTAKVKTVFLEVADGCERRFIEVWRKGDSTPHRFVQRFSRASDAPRKKEAFMAGLPARTFGLHDFPRVRRGEHHLDAAKLEGP